MQVFMEEAEAIRMGATAETGTKMGDTKMGDTKMEVIRMEVIRMEALIVEQTLEFLLLALTQI